MTSQAVTGNGVPPARRLPAEWEAQDAVILVWPHDAGIWEPEVPLAEAAGVVAAIAAAVSRFEPVLLIVPAPGPDVDALLRRAGARRDRIRELVIATDDCWARDFAPLTVFTDDGPRWLDFRFTGWGGKYPAARDDAFSGRLAAVLGMPDTRVEQPKWVLEGGSIDADGQGTLLTTAACQLGGGRNPGSTRQDVEDGFRHWLGIEHVHWLEHGYIAGDDTDGHVDMLARFAPGGQLLYASCTNPRDEHWDALEALAAEVRALRQPSGGGYRVRALPLPLPRRAADGRRLPASYVNYLVINGAVLMPTYRCPAADAQAAAVLADAFPGREVIGVDCLPVIHQHGSLHCLSMQLPKGVLP
jgi:agmatine deiminase